MKITHINNTDLPGRIFNGYDMMNTLNSLGHNCKQIVIDKKSDNENVSALLSKGEMHVRSLLQATESEIGSVNLLNPYTDKLINHIDFQNADIVHFHLLHNNMISMYELNKLLKSKPCVWTLHDPWIFTGHCIHPLDCEKWKTGCIQCSRHFDYGFPLYHNTAEQMWQIKKNQLQDIDIDVVVSTDFMVNYIRHSPLTSHFTKIHKIPFGIDLNSIRNIDKGEAKKKLNIPNDTFVIAIRDEENQIKGVKYFIEAVKKMDPIGITIISVGSGNMLSELSEKYNYVRLGWQNNADTMDLFYSAADVFVMPSLAETFGLMSIEAMAHQTPVICFKSTVLPEISHAGECGIAVEYKSPTALYKSLSEMKDNKDECIMRGKKGRKIVEKYYRYEDYISKHIELYSKLLK